MVNGIKTLLTKNIGWKIISLCVATILWFTVITSENPVRTEFFQVPLSIRNDQALQANNLVLMNRQELQGRALGISVRAPLSDLQTLRSSLDSFRAYVDLGPIDISQTMDIYEPMSINVRYEFPPFLQATRYTVMNPPETVTLILDRYVTRSFDIQVTRIGDVLPGFIYHPPVVNPPHISVSGPETIISSIDHVNAAVDLSDADADITRFLSIQIVDASGVDITDEVELDGTTVMVQIGVARYGDVPILEPYVFGSPAEGFVFSSVSVSPAAIEVVGDEHGLVVMQRSGIRLRPVSIEGLSQSFELVNDMREYLIDTDLHIRNLTPHETVTRVTLEPIVTVEFELNTQDIEFFGEIDMVVIDQETITITLNTAQSLAESLSADDITLSAQITGEALTAGSVLVHAELPRGIHQEGEVWVEISSVMPLDDIDIQD